MECNRDEALRAKQIAEKKFLDKDFVGAKKFVLKAQQLFPGLEGILHILASLNVHIAAENKICGQPDWYGVLGVDPLADEDTVRKQYRKLALMLHPDKNKSVGADAAFKLISEALRLLSDKNKRSAYDLKRNMKVQKTQTFNGGSSTAKKENCVDKSARPASNTMAPTSNTWGAPSTAASGAKSASNPVASRSNTQGTPPAPSAPAAPRPAAAAPRPSTAPAAPRPTAAPGPTAFDKLKSNTFWSLCRSCMMQYEHFRIYLNRKILCPCCLQPFLAEEIAPPRSFSSKPPTSWNFPNKRKNSIHHKSTENKPEAKRTNIPNPHVESGSFDSTGFYKANNFQQHPLSRPTGFPTSSPTATLFQQACEKVKRAREQLQAATQEEALHKKPRVPTHPVVPNRQ